VNKILQCVFDLSVTICTASLNAYSDRLAATISAWSCLATSHALPTQRSTQTNLPFHFISFFAEIDVINLDSSFCWGHF